MEGMDLIQVPIPGGHLPCSPELLRSWRPGRYRVDAKRAGEKGGKARLRRAGWVRVHGGRISLSAERTHALVFTKPELVLEALRTYGAAGVRFSVAPTKRQLLRASRQARDTRRRLLREKLGEAEQRRAQGEVATPARLAAQAVVSQPRRTRVREAWRTRRSIVGGILAAALALGGGTYAPPKRRGS